jgi:hypothetical protein
MMEEDGITPQAVADWLLAELNVRRLRVNLTTHRDDNIAPGATIAIASPTRLGISQNFWVQEVACEINRQNQFSQNLVCIGVVLPGLSSPATWTKSLTAKAAIRETRSQSLTAKAAIRVTRSQSFTANSVALRTRSQSLTANAAIQQTRATSVTANAIIVTEIAQAITAYAEIA